MSATYISFNFRISRPSIVFVTLDHGSLLSGAFCRWRRLACSELTGALMSLSDLASLGSFVSGVAVVFSFIFLAL
jgi:hypothetical protein